MEDSSVAADFYLASTEGYGMEEPRQCCRLRRVALKGGRELLLIRVAPALDGERYGFHRDLGQVLVAPRHKAGSFPL